MPKITDRRLHDRELLAKGLPLFLLQVAFFFVPLWMAVALTFQAMKLYRLTWTWSLETWTDIFTHWHYWSTLLYTIVLAAVCVVICLLIALPVAYAIATRLKAIENHIKVLIIFAFLADIVLKTYGWTLFLDKVGVLNLGLEKIGFGPEATDILFTPYATMIGMVYNLSPFLIFTVYLSVINLDRDLLHAAYDAGADKWRAFWEVTLPLCRPGILAGSILVFVLSLGVFLESKMLGGGKPPATAEMIRLTFETRVNWPLGAALTVMVVLVGMVAVFLFFRMFRSGVLGETR